MGVWSVSTIMWSYCLKYCQYVIIKTVISTLFKNLKTEFSKVLKKNHLKWSILEQQSSTFLVSGTGAPMTIQCLMSWGRAEAVMLALGSVCKYRWSLDHLSLCSIAQGLGTPVLENFEPIFQNIKMPLLWFVCKNSWLTCEIWKSTSQMPTTSSV